MRFAVALLASTIVFAGAAPAIAGDTGSQPRASLAACDRLGDRPTNGQVRDCVRAAEQFVESHRAMIEKARVEIRAHQADIDAAAKAMHDNADTIRQAEQELRSSMDAIRDAARELRENEGTLRDLPDTATPPAPAANAPAK